MTNGRGGHRDRAGRKSFFDEFRRLSIGGYAEWRLDRERQAKAKARVLAAHADLNLQATYAVIDDPKKKGLRSTYPASLEDDEAPEDHQTFAEQIQDAQNKVAQRERKHVILTGGRVYGVRSKVFEEIAAELSREVGRKVRPSYVRESLVLHRRFLKSLK